MKKVALLSLVAALIAGPVFAEEAGISFGAWGRGAFAPLIMVGDTQNEPADADDDGFLSGGTGATWGAPNIAVDLNVTGVSEYIGFGLGLRYSGGAMGFNDLGAHIWARPFGSDMFRVTMGRFVNDTLRGKQGATNHGFENFVLPGSLLGRYNEEDAIFQRFNQRMDFFPGTPGESFLIPTFDPGGNVNPMDEWDEINLAGANAPQQGFMFSSRLTEALFIGLGVTAPLFGADSSGIWNVGYDASLIWRTFQFGIGYDIEGIGSARAQILGGFRNIDGRQRDILTGAGHSFDLSEFMIPGASAADAMAPLASRIEIAFAYTAMENLLIDFGMKFHLPVTITEGAAGVPDVEMIIREGLFLALGANFQSGDFRLRARVEMDAARSVTLSLPAGLENQEWSDGVGFAFRLAPGFDTGFGIVGLDFGLSFRGDQSNQDGAIENTSRFQMGFGGFFERNLGSGLFKTGVTYTLPPSIGGYSRGNGVLSIPVILQYSF